VNGANHVAEMGHADVEAASVSEETGVEIFLVTLGVGGRVANRLSVFLLGVAAPHRVDGLLAGQKVVRTCRDHLHVADVDSDLVVLAVSVTVAQQTNLFRVGRDSLNIRAKLMLAASLPAPYQRVLRHVVIKGLRMDACLEQ